MKMNPTLCLLLLYLFFFYTSKAQVFNYTYSLEEVTFHESNGNWIIIYEDPIKNPDAGIPSEPVYINASTPISGSNATIGFQVNQAGEITEKPVGYFSNSKGKVSAKIKTSCVGQVYVRGYASGGYALIEKLVPVNNGYIEYPPTEFKQIFPNGQVQFFEDFSIDWYISQTPSNIPFNLPYGDFAGKSTNPLYVTHKMQSVSSNVTSYHSYLYIGCKAANGKKNTSEIVSDINIKFKSRCVEKYSSNRCMGYWADFDTIGLYSGGPPQTDTETCFDGEALLAYENGTCGTWARLMRNIFEVQGIEGSEVAIVKWKTNTSNNNFLTSSDNIILEQAMQNALLANSNDLVDIITHPSYTERAFFFVRDWNFNPQTDSFNLVRLNKISDSTSIQLPNGNEFFDVEQIGVPGQGNQDPRAYFKIHAIVKYNGKYYDPSYGTGPFSNAQEWKETSIDGFGAILRILYSEHIDSILNLETLNWVPYLTDQKEIIFQP